MDTHEWEFCAVAVDERQDHFSGLLSQRVEGWGYDVWLTFYRASGVQRQQVLDAARTITFDPFERLLCQLAGGGWELVSVQHADLRAGHLGHLARHGARLAYLKRPLAPDHADELPLLRFDEPTI